MKFTFESVCGRDGEVVSSWYLREMEGILHGHRS